MGIIKPLHKPILTPALSLKERVIAHPYAALYNRRFSKFDAFVKSHYPPPRRGGAEKDTLKIKRIFSASQRLRG